MPQRPARLLSAAFIAAGVIALTTSTSGRGQQPVPVVTSPLSPPVGGKLPVPAVPPAPPAAIALPSPNYVVGKAAQPKDELDKYADPIPDLPALDESGRELSLGECIAIAVERHPAIKAAQASLNATQAGSQSLQNFGTVGTLISPDLEIRKQQAQRGLTASAAEYQRAYNEVVQDVTRMYYTAVYARQQEAVARSIIPPLRLYIRAARALIDTEPDPTKLEGLSPEKIGAMRIGLRTALDKQVQAQLGYKRALAALRQAMGVSEQNFNIRPRDSELPVMEQTKEITKELVVNLAVERRPELALAAAGLDAFRLEVYAQAKIPFKRVVPTFASGSDLHAKDVPSAMRGKEYRPGGVGPEMPPQLVGSKYDRVCRAMAFSQRAEAVYESARGLVTLEAENGYYEFEQAGEKLRLAKESLDIGLEIQKRIRDRAPLVKAKDQLVQAEVLAANAQAAYVEAVWEHLLALGALERITAGGIRPAFPGR